jgi:hypothetical protein
MAGCPTGIAKWPHCLMPQECAAAASMTGWCGKGSMTRVRQGVIAVRGPAFVRGRSRPAPTKDESVSVAGLCERQFDWDVVNVTGRCVRAADDRGGVRDSTVCVRVVSAGHRP